MTDIDEGSIEAGHKLPDPADKDVTYGKVCFCPLLMDFDQPIVVEECNLHICRRCINDEFFVHDARLIKEKDDIKGGYLPEE